MASSPQVIFPTIVLARKCFCLSVTLRAPWVSFVQIPDRFPNLVLPAQPVERKQNQDNYRDPESGARIRGQDHYSADEDSPDHGHQIDGVARIAEVPRAALANPEGFLAPAEVHRNDIGKIEADDADGRHHGVG